MTTSGCCRSRVEGSSRRRRVWAWLRCCCCCCYCRTSALSVLWPKCAFHLSGHSPRSLCAPPQLTLSLSLSLCFASRCAHFTLIRRTSVASFVAVVAVAFIVVAGAFCKCCKSLRKTCRKNIFLVFPSLPRHRLGNKEYRQCTNGRRRCGAANGKFWRGSKNEAMKTGNKQMAQAQRKLK